MLQPTPRLCRVGILAGFPVRLSILVGSFGELTLGQTYIYRRILLKNIEVSAILEVYRKGIGRPERPMIRRWEDDWISFGHNATPQYVALSRLFGNDELQALIQFHGTAQRHFYTLSRFESSSRIDVPEKFASLEDAKAAA